MRKLIIVILSTLAILLVVVILLIASALIFVAYNSYDPIPYGIWQSEDPQITLYNDPEVIGISGTYVRGGEEIDIQLVRIPNSNIFYIDKAESVHTGVLYSGSYRIRNGQLHYTLRGQPRANRIVFEQIGEYEMPQLPYGVWQSEDPNIRIFMNRANNKRTSDFGLFPAIYIMDGVEMDALVSITTIGRNLRIYTQQDTETHSIRDFFVGNYRIVDDRIHFTPTPIRSPRWQAGIDTIIFERVE